MRFFILLSLLIAPLTALADIRVETPHMIAPPPNARSAAGYLTLVNDGAAADRLLGATSALGDVSIHKTETDANGVSRMAHQMAGVLLVPQSPVAFAPGGLHLMFMGLASSPAPGDTVTVTLRFETAGELTVDFAVVARGMAPAASHGHSGN